jgi:hypothetical protein
VKAETAPGTARKHRFDPAELQAPIDLVEHLREGRRCQPRKHPSAGRECAIGANQMFASRAHA